MRTRASAIGADASTHRDHQPADRAEVSEEIEFFGHTVAIKGVELRARVSGFIDKVAFKDVEIVEEGALLFQIDPRPFDAEVDRDQAALAVAKARAKRASADLAELENRSRDARSRRRNTTRRSPTKRKRQPLSNRRKRTCGVPSSIASSPPSPRRSADA